MLSRRGRESRTANEAQARAARQCYPLRHQLYLQTMSESEKKATPQRETSPQTTYTPEVVGKLIHYGLSVLSSENAHHDFEHLCRHLARRRIYSNVIFEHFPNFMKHSL